jgi:hypothetical protein
MQRSVSAASQNRDHSRELMPTYGARLCSAPLRKCYALRCVRGTRVSLDRYAHFLDHPRVFGELIAGQRP